MRESLKTLYGKRFEVFATVKKFGKKKAFKGPALDTVCLGDLTDKHKNPLTDHLWLIMRLGLKRLKLRVGDRIKFVARSTQYVKGYKGAPRDEQKCLSVDYNLSNPTGFVKLSGEEPVQIGLFEK